MVRKNIICMLFVFLILIISSGALAIDDSDSSEEFHNCRMYGAISNDFPDGLLLKQMVNDSASLKKLSQSSNINGWGIVSYPEFLSSNDISRGPIRAYNDPNFDSTVIQLTADEPKIVLGHIRACTQGCCAPIEGVNNPHPFTRYSAPTGKTWSFEHNGNVDKARLITLIGTSYLSSHGPFGSGVSQCNVTDPSSSLVVDSELYFLYVLKMIEDNGGNALLGITTAVKNMQAAGVTGAANFIMTDGDTIYGFRNGNDLSYTYNATGGYSVVASQATSGSWTTMSNFQLVILTKDKAPVLIPDVRTYVVDSLQITNIAPADDELIIAPISQLSFNIADSNNLKMNYIVTSTPNIGSKNATGVSNGAITVPISGLVSGNTYTWHITLTNGMQTLERDYSFTYNIPQIAPQISAPNPYDSEVLTSTITRLRFNIIDANNDTMNYTVTTTPNIGSGNEVNVKSGNFSVPVSGIVAGTYTWNVTATDGVSSVSNVYTFTYQPGQGNVQLTEANPNNTIATYNPRLSVRVTDPEGSPLTVIFETNATGTWEILGTYDGGNGVYTQDTPGKMEAKQRFYWRVRVYDGSSWTTRVYSFTAQPFVLKWTYNTNATTTLGPLAVDVNNDGIYEIFTTGEDTVTCIDGATGSKLWSYVNTKIMDHAPIEIHDLNNDGIPELVVTASTRTIALHANNGSVYWNVLAESEDKHLVILDTEGNGYPYVYIASEDITHGENGTGRLRKLRGTDGAVLAETFSWRPCWGGLSADDVNNDGKFEIYMTDRRVNYTPGELGKGMQAYDADTLDLLWYEEDVTCSSHCMALVDVNDDGVRDAVAIQQSTTNGGLYVVDGATGVKMSGKWANTIGLLGHSQPSIWDIDGDGNLEIITSRNSVAKVWDIGSWTLDATLENFDEPPKMADVIGDSSLEIIGVDNNVIIYDKTYTEIERILAKARASTLVQDIDNDGQNELILVNALGNLMVYDTSAYAPTPRVRTNALYYSERRLGVGVYIPPPGAPQPFLEEESPVNGATDVGFNPTLSIQAIDYHYDLMDIVVSTNASGTWQDIATLHDVTNGVYNFTTTNMDAGDTVYYWKVSATDSHADNITTTKTFSFRTMPQTETSSYRKAITIDHSKVTENLVNFPVLIDIADSDLALHAQSDANDIYFTTEDKSSKLDFEIESYDAGHLVAWVKTDLSSTEDTILYINYGAPSNVSKANPVGVWDSNYLAVHHLEEIAGTVLDSTSNDNDGTPLNDVSLDVIGKIDGGDQFDGVNDREQLPRVFTDQSQFTFEAWVNTDNKQGYIVSQRDTSSRGAFLQYTGGQFQLYANNVHVDKSTTVNVWHYVVGTYDGSTARLYIDAGAPVSATASLTWPNLNTLIGDRTAADRQFKGKLDEIRLSNVARSEGYIKTSYNNQNNPNTFYSLGSEESITTMPTILNENPTNNAIDVATSTSQLSFELFDNQGDLLDYNVTTIPNIGSKSDTGVSNGIITLPISGLESGTTYTWSVHVSDGNEERTKVFTFTTSEGLLTDSTFDSSIDSADLRLNVAGQDWFESRAQAPTLLTLDTGDVAGNSGSKAAFAASSSTNAYLSQEFREVQSGNFSVEWDIYVDSILDISSPDRAGWMLIGDDSTAGSGPNANNAERFVYMAFFKNGGGTSGTMDLIAVDRDDTFTAFTTIASNLSMKQWYNIRVDLNLDADTYDVYVDDVFQKTVTSRIAKTSVSHISFAQWNDGAGAFYVDNVKEYIPPACIDADGDGYGTDCALGVDCDDTNNAIHPNASDSNCNGVDNDCDGSVDEDYLVDSGCFLPGACAIGNVASSCNSGIETLCTTGTPAVDDTSCNNIDDDCNGLIDEDYVTTSTTCGVGACSATGQLSCTLGVESNSCVVGMPIVEACDNNIDDDCDGKIDEGCTAWPMLGWNYRKAITIDHSRVVGSLSSFPVLIDLTDSNVAEHAQTSGVDLVFTATDGVTILDYELESYNAGHVVAWVEADVSSTEDTIIYLYYGNSNTTSLSNPVGVWDSNYLAVQHLEETSGIVLDSTDNGNDGNPLNGVSQDIVGRIDGGDQFDGIDDKIQLPKVFSTETQFTIEGWMNTVNKQGYMVSQRDLSNRGAFIQHNINGLLQFYVNDKYVQSSTTLNSWHYVVGTYDGSTARLYIDAGTPVSIVTTLTWPDLQTLIGDRTAGARSFQGKLDEIRLSNVARSESYIRTSYNNQNSPQSFVTLGTEEEYTIDCVDADNDGYSVTGLTCGPIDCVDTNNAIYPGAEDSFCNGVDNDCDLSIDEDYNITPTTCGVGACEATGSLTCVAGIENNTCTAGLPASDDTSCNNIDDDCNGFTDDGYVSTPTTCGVGACAAAGQLTCNLGVESDTCTVGNSSIESCDNLDNDCDGSIDEDLTQITTCGLGICSNNTGFETCTLGVWANNTCDAFQGAIPEVCDNSLDDNCDGNVDEGCVAICTDADNDTFAIEGGDCGFVDCNDANAAINPNATDSNCNNVDDDCDLVADEDYTSTPTTCGVGACSATGQLSCTLGVESDTCTPGTPTTEICGNGIDENCDGADEICPVLTLLADSAFDSSVDSVDLRTNVAGQDWYESRAQAPTLLTLDNAAVGGNSGKKAKFDSSSSTNAYLSQEFREVQSGNFSVEWDIYVDSILDISSPDRAGWMLIGDDSTAGNGPNAANGERFVYMAFFKNGGGTNGTMDLIVVDRDDTFAVFTTIASNLSIKQWYNIRVDLNLDADTYDVFVDGVFQKTVTSRIAKTSVSHISFAQWNDGAGTFYVDNVKEYIPPACIDADGDGYGTNCALGVDCDDTNNAMHPNALDSNCNNVDENCNGIADDGYVSDTSCFLQGACAISNVASSCTAGIETVCSTGIPASNDTSCNNIDDDCNGFTDDGYVATPTTCGVGACAAVGHLTCNLGVESDTCLAGDLSTEICDNIDNDCDGTVDEDWENLGDSCSLGLGVCQVSGMYVCDMNDPSGQTVCDSATPGIPGTETCGNLLDDDCDGFTDEDCAVMSSVSITSPADMAQFQQDSVRTVSAQVTADKDLHNCVAILDPIDASGNLVDDDGNPVDEEGNSLACKLFAAHGTATKDGITIIGKDRDWSAYSRIKMYEAQDWTLPQNINFEGNLVPQVAHTYKWFAAQSTLEDKSANMGMNENGVIIIESDQTSWDDDSYTSGKYLRDQYTTALILQRAVNASHAIDIIDSLIDNTGWTTRAETYIIGDKDHLWVVEVTGKNYVAKPLDNEVYGMGNYYSIGKDWNNTGYRYSSTLVQHASNHGCDIYTQGFSMCYRGIAASNNFADITSKKGNITIDDIRGFLDSHRASAIAGIGVARPGMDENTYTQFWMSMTDPYNHMIFQPTWNSMTNAALPIEYESWSLKDTSTGAQHTFENSEGEDNAYWQNLQNTLYNEALSVEDTMADYISAGDAAGMTDYVNTYVYGTLSDSYTQAKYMNTNGEHDDSKGIIRICPGTPFCWTTDSTDVNPTQKFNMTTGESKTFNWDVKATGETGTYTFFVDFVCDEGSYRSENMTYEIIAPVVCSDTDADGYNSTGSICGPIDCVDTNNAIYPGASESTCNGLDNDCDLSIDEDYNITVTICGIGACSASGQLSCTLGVESDSCVATDPNVESCDNIDNDCDGTVDEDLTQITTCGLGICSNNTGVETCTLGIWANNTCDAFLGAVIEVCDNLLDDDCDGLTDLLDTDDCTVAECTSGDTRSCGSDVGECSSGLQTCTDGTWGTECVGVVLPQNETCDGLDNNCDGTMDEDWTNLGQECNLGLGVCLASGQYVCNALGTAAECNAVEGTSTGTDDDCNGLDENCDGIADNAYVSTSTSCGVGVCAATGITSCALGVESDSCIAGTPDTEVCGNAIDEDCNGVAETCPALLADSTFDVSIDSADLRNNATTQDWYDSRAFFPTGSDTTLITLNTDNVAGNSGNKARLKNNVGTATNAYLTQEFSTIQTQTFNLSFDIYIESIENSGNYDRTGNIYIGDNSVTTNAPTGGSAERFVVLGFYDSTPDTTGSDIQLRALQTGGTFATTSTWTLIDSGLSYDTWYKVKLVMNPVTGTYDIYVNDLYKSTMTKFSSTATLRYISFVADSDARGDFYVDNVYSPAIPYVPPACIDNDGDGYGTNCALGADCDDNNNLTYPGASEVCDGVDNDCNAGTFDGSQEAWYGDSCDGSDLDLCAEGTWICTGTQLCSDDSFDNIEICGNSIDEDCSGADLECALVCGDGVIEGTEVCDDNNMNAGDGCSDVCAVEAGYTCIGTPSVCTLDCVASEEVCDNMDNDCDGSIDEDLSRGTFCGLGACSGNTGTETCSAGVWGSNTCDPYSGATLEACDGTIDENCDGTVDEGCDCTSGDTRSCGSDVGECSSGLQTCTGGTWGTECVGEVVSQAESCDALDNDCDGTVDEDWTNLGQECNLGLGACMASGQYVCNMQGTAAECNAVEGLPVTEVCDNLLDDDCDGLTDLLDTADCAAGECTSGDTQLCTLQTGVCLGSQEVCADNAWPGCDYFAIPTYATTDSCDDLDNDCDGTTDEDYSSTPTSCGVGACAAVGATSCIAGSVQDSCVAGTPVTEVCGNGIDEDCNGAAEACPALLADSTFDASIDSADLRTNGASQDWYESRAQAPTLLTLDETDVGGNSGKKARFNSSSTTNAYLSQEFSSVQTGSFSAEWDIYVDTIMDISSPDRAGWMLIGDDSTAGNGPNAANGERFVYMGFFKNGGGTSGTMDLVAVNRTGSFSAAQTIASGLNMDQWYNIRVDLNLDADTYDVYVDDVLQGTVTSRIAKTSVSHISFAQWNDGAGTFYVDNVNSPALN